MGVTVFVPVISISNIRFNGGLAEETINQGGRPLDGVDKQSPSGGSPPARHYSRLRIGKFVLQREGWQMPVNTLPEVKTDDEFTLFLNAYAWARRYSFPKEMFARIWPNAQSQSTRLQTLNKPMLIDFDNYFTIRMLFHQISGELIDFLYLEEMLPNPAQHFLKFQGQAHVMELQIELNREALRDE